MSELDRIFQIQSNNLKPAKGRVLISEPLLNDYFFKRSVILLTEHNDEGSMGFVINNPIDTELNNLLPEFPDFDANISIGGPVSTDMIQFIHTLGKQISGCIEIKPDLFWGGDFEIIKLMAKAGKLSDDDIRFFIGYSGWAEKQLDEEIAGNFWLIAEHFDNIAMEFRNKDNWGKLLDSIGNKYKHWVNVPDDPSLN